MPATAAPDPLANSPAQDLPETIFPGDNLVRRGWCTVANDKARAPAPHKLYYGASLVSFESQPCSPAGLRAELHGQDEPTSYRMVFTMGLNNSSFVSAPSLPVCAALTSHPLAGLAQPSLALCPTVRLLMPGLRQPRRGLERYAAWCILD